MVYAFPQSTFVLAFGGTHHRDASPVCLEEFSLTLMGDKEGENKGIITLCQFEMDSMCTYSFHTEYIVY